MRHIIYTIFFLLTCYNVVAQTKPSSFPVPYAPTGYYRIGWVKADSGLISSLRDTNYLPRFSGTITFRPQNIRPYYYDSTALRWYKLFSEPDTLTTLATRYDLIQNRQNLQEVTDVGQKTTDTIVAGGLRTGQILGDTADLADYEIDIFPDLQVESHQDADTTVLGAMFNWVVANRDIENIKALLQVGDLTQDATTTQFDNVDYNYDKIDAMPAPQLPYLAVPGNHDFDGGGVGGGRFFTVYNTYMGPSRFAGKTFYGNSLNNSNDNYYIKFKAANDSILVLGLEFLPRDSTLTWAQSVLDSFPDHKTIIVTHAYITSYGEKSMDTSRFSTDWYGLVNDNDGLDIWNKMLKQNKQIMFVFNGHYINNTTSVAQALSNTNLGFPAVKRITQAGENGNVVNQFIVNYQTDSLGGNGYFMRIKFKPRIGRVDISFYSAYLNRSDARFPSYSLDYPSINVDASVGFSAKNGNVNVAGETRFDSSVFVTQHPKNRIMIGGINGKVDTLFNDVSGKALFSTGIDQKPTFRSIATTDLPTDSGKYILNQLTNPQTGNFWIKGKGVVGTHNNYTTVLAGLPAQFWVTTGSANWGVVSARAAGAGGGGSKFCFYTTRGADFANPVAVALGDALGELTWFGTATDLTARRSMYLRGFVYGVTTNAISSGFDFRATNTSFVDAQLMHMHPDGHTVIGTGAVSLIDRLKVDGTLLITDTVKTPNIITKFDTTSYKPVVADANGNHFKMVGWPITSPTVTTLYTGDGTLAGNRSVNANNLNLTFSDVNTFRINHDVFALSKADGTFPYSNVIVAPAQQWWLGYTPTVGSFSKGSAIAIDTNNNVALGTSAPPATAPLYADGAAYLHGLQSGRGNFYRVSDFNADHTMALTEYWANIDASGGNVTITLPAASSAFGSSMGIQYVFKRTDASANTVTVQRNATPGTDLIDGAASFTIVGQYTVKEVQCVSTSAFAIR